MAIYEESYENDGKKLAYLRYGEWSDTVILFFHGFFGASGYLPQDAGRDMCVISFDRPGIGRSDLIGRYKMEDLFKIINACLKSHGVRAVRVFGHSAGGYYAQAYCEFSGDYALSLTLLSSLPPMNSRKFDHLLNKSMKNRRFLTLYCKPITRMYFISAAKVLANNASSVAEQYIAAMSEREQEFMKTNRQMYESVIVASAANRGKGAFHDAISMYARRDVTLPSGLPVYVWNGTADTTITLETTEFMAKTYNARSVHIIEGGTHHMYLVHWHEAVKEALGGA